MFLRGWRQWLVALTFLLAVSATVLFGVRAIRQGMPHRNDEQIRGWMSIQYIAHSYHVPPHILYEAVGLPPRPPDKRPIRDIAKAQHRSTDEIKIVLMSAITHARPPAPPPPSALTPASPPVIQGDGK